METLLTIIPRVYNKEAIANSFCLYSSVVIYIVILSILFMLYKKKNDLNPEAIIYAATISSIILNFVIIHIICSFIFQYYTTKIPFLFLWEILIFIMVISYVLIFLLFPQACLGGLISAIIIPFFYFFAQTLA